MNVKIIDILKKLVLLVVFVLGVYLVICGRTVPGWDGLWVMLVGFIILLVLLYLYNGKYK